jgi:membrane-bound lytic murein transglycosylase D
MQRVLLLTIVLVMLTACAPFQQRGLHTPKDPSGGETVALRPDPSRPGDSNPQLAVVPVPESAGDSVDQAPLSPQEESALETEPQIHFALDGPETKEMEFYFLYYTRTHRETFQRWLKRAEPYLPYIREHFVSRGLPEELIYLPFAESGFNPWAYSRAGAAGLWQFMPFTGKHYGLQVDWWIDERRDPYLSTRAAADYLEKLYKDFGDWYLALAAYNAGEGRIARALSSSGCDNFFDLVNGENTLKQETRHYVPKFLAILKIIRNLESLGFEPLNLDGSVEPVRLEVKGGSDLLALSASCGLTWEEFRRFNPSYRKMISPPDTTSAVYLPKEKKEQALAYLEKPESRPLAGFTRHKVKPGESMWAISKRYDVPIDVIRKLNEKKTTTLRPGEWLMVPGKASASVADSTERTKALARERSNYVVKSGDTVWSIAQSSGISVSTLLKANGLSNPRALKVGQKLHIPSASGTTTRVATKSGQKTEAGRLVQYQVREGDTLWSIARKFGVSHKELQTWNGLKDTALIRPGDSLKVYVR